MCGIGGLVAMDKNPVSKQLIKSVMDIVSHRGPDDEGFYFDGHLALGHRRLSIIDRSPDGHQPMECEDYCIVFNGEIYNYLELREELNQLGYQFRTKTDTEVIVRAYQRWGEGCLDRFNGMWSIALYDKRKNILFCSRDRFGVKPFYYTQQGNFFAFGSEIKQFTVLPAWQAIGNYEQILNFLVFNVFNQDAATLFKNVFQLPGGHLMYFDLNTNRKTIRQWYSLDNKKSKKTFSNGAAEKAFKDLLLDSVNLRLRSDVKVGSCLSGGLDSSTIVCFVNENLRKQNKAEIQETVSSCSTIAKYDEQIYINEVVKHTGVKSHRIFPDYGELTMLIEKITWHMDQPFASASPFAQWNVFKKAKEAGLIVMLDGQGADEQLAGYSVFYELYLISLFRNMKFRKLWLEYKSLKKMKKIGFLKLASIIIKGLVVRNSALWKLANTSLPSWLKADISKNLYHPYRAKTLRDLSIQQLYSNSLPMLLHYEDRNSMAFSVESRVPFLDYRLAEFLINLPDDTKLKNGETKFVMRKSLKDTLPSMIVNRHDKMAFVTPESVWIRENASFVEQYLLVAAERIGSIDKIDLINSFKKDLASGMPAGTIYWRLMSLGIWSKVFSVNTFN